MANPYLTQATGNGATTDFTLGFTMDSDLTYLDVTCTLNGTKITNFTKLSTTQVRFTAPIPSGALVFERYTPGGRKYVFTPGTRIIASQVGGEFDRQSADSLEAGQFSWRNYYTAKSNAGAWVRIDALGEHEILDIPAVGPTPTWGSPGAIGAAAPNTGVFTNLSATGTLAVTGNSTLGAVNVSGLTTFSGAVNYAGTQAQKDDTALSLGLSNGFFNFRNKFINADWRLWQRQQSATPSLVNPTNGVYFADRWYYTTVGSTATLTVSRQSHTVGQTLVPGEPKYFMQFVQTVAPVTINGFGQRIEDVRTFAGQNINIRFYGKFDTARSISYTVTQNFGTGGAPSGNVTVASGSVSVTSTFAGYNIFMAVPSISGKTLGTTDSSSFLQVEFTFPLTAAFTYQVSDLQIEAVQTAGSYTRYERRPDQMELLLAKRYYQVFLVSFEFYTSGASTLGKDYQCNPTMRAGPVGREDLVVGTAVGVTLSPLLGNTPPQSRPEGFKITGNVAAAGVFAIDNWLFGFSAEL